MIVNVDTESGSLTPVRISWSSCTEPLHLTIFEANQLYFQLWAALMVVGPELQQPEQSIDAAPIGE
jgi:hypothetical protein